MWVGAILIVLAAKVWITIRKHRQRWTEADTERDRMVKLIFELREDPTMSDRKWAEWLPVFEYFDRYYAANNFRRIRVKNLADYVREEIDDKSFLQGA